MEHIEAEVTEPKIVVEAYDKWEVYFVCNGKWKYDSATAKYERAVEFVKDMGCVSRIVHISLPAIPACR